MRHFNPQNIPCKTISPYRKSATLMSRDYKMSVKGNIMFDCGENAWEQIKAEKSTRNSESADRTTCHCLEMGKQTKHKIQLLSYFFEQTTSFIFLYYFSRYLIKQTKNYIVHTSNMNCKINRMRSHPHH